MQLVIWEHLWKTFLPNGKALWIAWETLLVHFLLLQWTSGAG
jgi:hypothetical protein